MRILHRVAALAVFVVLMPACASRTSEKAPAAGSAASASAPPPALIDVPAAQGSLAPRLSRRPGPAGGLVLSWLEPTAEGMSLDWSEMPSDASAWSPSHEVVSSARLLPNAADTPGVVALSGGRMLAHWRETREPSGAGYDTRAALSFDGGKTWEQPVTPHRDGADVEHGFVVALDASAPGGAAEASAPDRANLAGDGAGAPEAAPDDLARDAGLAWLDGRDAAAHPESFSTQLLTTTLATGSASGLGSETVLDPRTCDCCPVSIARAGDITILAYRDRTDDDVRDVAVVRRLASGEWTRPALVHEDGWRILGCPVNGPALDAEGARAAIAWFSAAQDAPRLLLAFSDDAGATWSDPLRVDDAGAGAGMTGGQAGVALMADGSALVTWIVRSDAGATLVARRIPRSGAPGAMREMARGVIGIPQVARDGASDRVMLAWAQSTGAPAGAAPTQQRRIVSTRWAP